MQAVTQRTLQSLLRNSTRHANNKKLTSVKPYICAQCIHQSRQARNTTPKSIDPVAADEVEQPLQKSDDETQSATVLNLKANTTSSENEPSPEELLAKAPLKTTGSDPPNDQPTPRSRGRPIGSRLERSRMKVIRERAPPSPKPRIPDWFIESSILLPQKLADNAGKVILVDDIVEKEITEVSQDVTLDDKTAHAQAIAALEAVEGSLPGSAVAVIDTSIEADKDTQQEQGELSSPVEVKEDLINSNEPETTKTKDISPVIGQPVTSKDVTIEPSVGKPPVSPLETPPATTLDGATDSAITSDTPTGLSKNDQASSLTSIDSSAYLLNEIVWREILASVKGSLTLPKTSFNQGFFAAKSNVVLVYPQEDGASGTYFLDAVSEKIAAEVGATLVRIDAQDIEEIAGDFLGESKPGAGKVSPISSHILRSLGYQTQLQHSSNKNPEEFVQEPPQTSGQNGEEAAEEEEEEEDEDDDHHSEATSPPHIPLMSKIQNLLGSGKLVGAAVIRDGVMTPINQWSASKSSDNGLNMPSARSKGEQAQQAKITALLSAMIDSAKKKLDSQDPPVTATSDIAKQDIPKKIVSKPKIIVNVRDYRELERLHSGDAILALLVDNILERRKNGQEIMVLGTSCLRYSARGLDKPWLSFLQRYPTESVERTIIVPSQASQTSRDQMKRDRASRLREINMRHIRDTIRRRSGDGPQAVHLVIPKDWHFPSEAALHPQIPEIDKWIWDEDKVHRIALTVLGSLESVPPSATERRTIDLAKIAKVVSDLTKSDEIKLKWATESTKQAEVVEKQKAKEKDARTTEEKSKEKLEELSKTCTTHEKKLLQGVVNPENIKVGFRHVQAPTTTIEALQTLTSLSLERPEAFKYGVLASDRIPGVLLYGPPGTGKTLLAKAVAKESGATVLEVSGSEVFDMYVGEAEKNVKAIFTLAKKLSPCVVFIDEADAIFGSRHSHSTRTTHRELINQFLKEWDGMAQTTAFMMVATNRPFDLDDAVLRRLPRRILVDLPTADDRLGILKIHLAEETLDASVNLNDIASDARTNLYSGSDLKNLSVAAALTCVREENDSFKTTGKYPEKRVLEQRHFDKALNEITASISEDMGSLGLIRKFDEKYGDRSGKKKKPMYGFTSAAGMEDLKEKGSGRVRK